MPSTMFGKFIGSAQPQPGTLFQWTVYFITPEDLILLAICLFFFLVANIIGESTEPNVNDWNLDSCYQDNYCSCDGIILEIQERVKSIKSLHLENARKQCISQPIDEGSNTPSFPPDLVIRQQ